MARSTQLTGEAVPEAQASDRFAAALARSAAAPLRRGGVATVQANLGKLCNMACLHCHVEAGPTRTEVMREATIDRLLDLLRTDRSIEVLDLTGGAPELNPGFRRLVREARKLGLRVLDRCNLTILFEPGMEDLAAFLAAEGVDIVASLPCYEEANVEKQRGKGAFPKSIEALRVLNALGYGAEGSGLRLDLVYNPVGAVLPPAAADLELRYKEELGRLFGIRFHHLLTITNMPLSRFAHALRRDGLEEAYLGLLERSFNPTAAGRVMCRDLVSVAFDGRLHDCDFHQMAGLPLGAGERSLWTIASFQELTGAPVRTADHCLGCTAGAGSSCSGALA